MPLPHFRCKWVCYEKTLVFLLQSVRWTNNPPQEGSPLLTASFRFYLVIDTFAMRLYSLSQPTRTRNSLVSATHGGRTKSPAMERSRQGSCVIKPQSLTCRTGKTRFSFGKTRPSCPNVLGSRCEIRRCCLA